MRGDKQRGRAGNESIEPGDKKGSAGELRGSGGRVGVSPAGDKGVCLFVWWWWWRFWLLSWLVFSASD